MTTIELSAAKAAVRAELSVTEDWRGTLEDYEAPGWKLEEADRLIADLLIEAGLADLDDGLTEEELEFISDADRSGLWDC